jgi:hypothetical protein
MKDQIIERFHVCVKHSLKTVEAEICFFNSFHRAIPGQPGYSIFPLPGNKMQFVLHTSTPDKKVTNITVKAKGFKLR